MKYACLVYHDQGSLDVAQEELQGRIRGCGAWVGDLQRGGNHVFSAGLQSSSTATTLRSRNGKISVTDGPFAETKEFLAGLTVIEARDLNEALREASKLAACSLGTIEVRAILEPGAAVATAIDRKILAAIGEATNCRRTDNLQETRR